LSLFGLNDLLIPAQKDHYAIGAYNFSNTEMAQATMEEGVALRSPVMYIISPMEARLLGVKTIVRMIDWLADEAGIPVCLHLDHASDIESVKESIDAGFPSVMIDASQKTFEENIRITRTVVDMAREKGVTVEGELGAVGRTDGIEAEGAGHFALADPGHAAEYVERTGVDALAISIGNAHGLYTQMPQLDFDLLSAVRDKVDVPLVLHGGSGTPADQLHKAIELGICKVNVASEIGKAYVGTIIDTMTEKAGKIWYTEAIIDAKAAVREVVRRWMNELGSINRL
jgi:ketose-bisphosphate aldolase